MSLQVDQGNLMIIQCIIFFIEILYQPLIRSSTFASVRMYNEKEVNYAD